MGLERMGQKSSENLLAGIAASKDRGLARLLNGLSIRHVGTRVAAVLAERFRTMDALRKASVEELSETNEIGPDHCQERVRFSARPFRPGDDRRSAEPRRGDGSRRPGDPPRPGALEGKTLVVTGTLSKYSRDEINELITRHGGHAASSVSKSTDYLIAGENAGSKLDKAEAARREGNHGGGVREVGASLTADVFRPFRTCVVLGELVPRAGALGFEFRPFGTEELSFRHHQLPRRRRVTRQPRASFSGVAVKRRPGCAFRKITSALKGPSSPPRPTP